jgi:hypothetical protein
MFVGGKLNYATISLGESGDIRHDNKMTTDHQPTGNPGGEDGTNQNNARDGLIAIQSNTAFEKSPGHMWVPAASVSMVES